MTIWSQNSDLIVFAQGNNLHVRKSEALTQLPVHLNIVRAYAGQTHATTAETVFDTDDFNEREYLAMVRAQSGNFVLTMNWYVSTSCGCLELC